MPVGSYILYTLPPPRKECGCQIIYFFRPCSNNARAEQEHRLDGVLLEARPQVRQEKPHCGEEPLDADLRHRERSELKVTGPHRSGVGWFLVLVVLFIDALEHNAGSEASGLQPAGWCVSSSLKNTPSEYLRV